MGAVICCNFWAGVGLRRWVSSWDFKEPDRAVKETAVWLWGTLTAVRVLCGTHMRVLWGRPSVIRPQAPGWICHILH